MQHFSEFPVTSDDLLNWMRNNDLRFELFEHEPLHSVSDSKHVQELIDPSGQGVHVKNLFLRSAKKAQFLVTLEQDRKIDLKALGSHLGKGKLSFGSPERLMTALGVKPGAVTPLAMIQGTSQNVAFYLDPKVWSGDIVFMHPLINTRTISLEKAIFRRFLELIEAEVTLLDENLLG